MTTVRIDAQGLHYTPLNRMIREAVAGGAIEIIIDNVMGQRFIADGLKGNATLVINGVPGGDLGMFMSGPTCVVNGNCEHAPGNTMDEGTIVIHGSAGDAVAHSMRGGRVLVRDSIGYRGGIHMKQYDSKRPQLIIGGCARAYLGEYMAGGEILVLGTGCRETVTERGIGSGIHGGAIFVRGEVDEWYLGVGAKTAPLTNSDREDIEVMIREFSRWFGTDADALMKEPFTKIVPSSARPFANKYTWE